MAAIETAETSSNANTSDVVQLQPLPAIQTSKSSPLAILGWAMPVTQVRMSPSGRIVQRTNFNESGRDVGFRVFEGLKGGSEV